MKRLLALTALVVPLIAYAAEGTPDASFLKSAAEGGTAEVQDGMLAQDKGSSQAVKDFGAEMVKDHTAGNEKVQSLAASKDVKLPDHASMMQMAEHKKLDALSGKSFDDQYIKGQVTAHRETIKLFRKEASSGKDPQVRDLAKEMLPTLERHLRKIEKIATEAGVHK